MWLKALSIEECRNFLIGQFFDWPIKIEPTFITSLLRLLLEIYKSVKNIANNYAQRTKKVNKLLISTAS